MKKRYTISFLSVLTLSIGASLGVNAAESEVTRPHSFVSPNAESEVTRPHGTVSPDAESEVTRPHSFVSPNAESEVTRPH